jgi:hypothetical protein
MPYLTNEDKIDFNFGNRISDLTDYLNQLKIESLSGHINYLNFIIIKRWIKKNGKKYFVFAAIVGTLVCCILEIYRRLIVPYETEKINSNGDAE